MLNYSAMSQFVLSFVTCHRVCNTRNKNGVTRVDQEGYSSREWLIQLYFCTFCKKIIFFWTVWAMPEFVLSFETYHRICNTRNKNGVTRVEQEGYSSREWLIQLYFCNICKFIIFFWTVWARSEFVLSFMTHRWLCNTSNTTVATGGAEFLRDRPRSPQIFSGGRIRSIFIFLRSLLCIIVCLFFLNKYLLKEIKI